MRAWHFREDHVCEERDLNNVIGAISGEFQFTHPGRVRLGTALPFVMKIEFSAGLVDSFE